MYSEYLYLNVNGAEKTADFLGKILKENFDLPDRRTDEKEAALWAAIGERYDAAKKAGE